MLDFPKSTFLHCRLPKEAFYGNMQFTPALKNAFVSDLDRIYIEYGLTQDGLNLSRDSELEVIYIMRLGLKKKDYDHRILEVIARQNPHKLLFLLSFEEQAQLALYQGKLFSLPWTTQDALVLDVRGQSLLEIWDSFVAQVALREDSPTSGTDRSVEERLLRQEKRQKLEKQIASLETKVRKEKQLNKQMQLNAELKKMKKELEEL